MTEKPFSKVFFLSLVHILSVNGGKKGLCGKSVESSLKLTWDPGYEDRGQGVSSPVLRGCKDSPQKYKMLPDSLKHGLQWRKLPGLIMKNCSV